MSPKLIDSGYDGEGPVVEVAYSDGNGWGISDVADAMARVFPAYKAFATKVLEAFDLPLGSYTFGPYPYDRLTYKSKTMVEYRTPAQTDGLGTRRWLKKNGTAIDGVAILTGPTPDLVVLSVRLPPKLAKSTPAIVKEVEREATR